MVERRENLIGIDVFIDRIQYKIHDPLIDKWGDIDIYGRVYKKKDSEGNISLERFSGNGEYKKVLFSEGNKIFFVQGNNPEINFGRAKNDLWLVCIVKLDWPGERGDERYHVELMTELEKVVGQDKIDSLEYGFENLKRVLEDSFDFGNFKFSDIHPYHVFSIKMVADYEISINNC